LRLTRGFRGLLCAINHVTQGEVGGYFSVSPPRIPSENVVITHSLRLKSVKTVGS